MAFQSDDHTHLSLEAISFNLAAGRVVSSEYDMDRVSDNDRVLSRAHRVLFSARQSKTIHVS